MYYANKSTFYIKQYGPAVLILIISFVLIGSGIYIYLKSDNSSKPVTNIVADNKVDETTNKEVKTETEVETKVEEKKNEEVKEEVKVTSTNILEELNSLGVLEKSNKYKVSKVNDTGSVVISNGNTDTTVYLIGVDIKDKKAINNMKTDILNKEITIAFDNQRTENKKMYVYLYDQNDKLYNETILKSGFAVLKTERENVKVEF